MRVFTSCSQLEETIKSTMKIEIKEINGIHIAEITSDKISRTNFVNSFNDAKRIFSKQID